MIETSQGNCKEAIHKRVSKESNVVMTRLCKAMTKETYKYLKFLLHEENPDASLLMDKKKELFSMYEFLDKGYSHYGQVTNNPSKQLNYVLRIFRQQPITDIF